MASLCAGELGVYRCPSRATCGHYLRLLAIPVISRDQYAVIALHRAINSAWCAKFEAIRPAKK